MEYKEHEWHSRQEDDVIGQAQVPSTLLPNVLRHLRLESEQVASSLDDVLAQLKSEDWRERVTAVRALGRLEVTNLEELLGPALEDIDGSVRAAAVHVLARMGQGERKGQEVSLQRLVAALHDADWQVRETAVLDLGRRAGRIPREVLMTALYDTDALVRESARLALQWQAADTKTSGEYGRLWEQKSMQQERYDIPSTNGRRTSFESGPSANWNADVQYNQAAAQSHSMREQAQMYAPQEYVSPEAAYYEHGGEYAGEMPSRWEKVTSYQPIRKRSKGLWIALIVVALFFAMGAMSMGWWMHTTRFGPVNKIVAAQQAVQPYSHDFPFDEPKYASIARASIAQDLHLLPQQISAQIQQGKSMQDIAVAQGVSASDLRTIELRGMQSILNAVVNSGDISQQEADKWMITFQTNPSLLDKMTVTMFTMPAFDKAPVGPPAGGP